MNNFRKRHYVMDLDFQRRFIAKFVFAMLVGMAASILLFNHLAMNALEGLKWRMVIFERSLADVIVPYMVYIAIFAVALTVFLLWVVSKFLHRDVVGVIFRLRKDMEEVSRGNLRLHIALRKADSFKDTAHELDRAVTNLRNGLRKTEGIFRETKRIADSIGEVREEFLPEKCARLAEKARELEESLGP